VPKPLPSEVPEPFVLFVAGEPEMAPGIRESGIGVIRRIDSMVGLTPPAPKSPENNWDPNTQGPTDQRPWHIPHSQMACVQITLDAAKSRRRQVVVVDVNRPGERQCLVDQWVGRDDLFPLLVRADGARIEGQENFLPTKVRRFLDVR
jgi:hypothetical protein